MINELGGSDVGIDIIVKLDSYTLTLHDLFISKKFFVYYIIMIILVLLQVAKSKLALAQ